MKGNERRQRWGMTCNKCLWPRSNGVSFMASWLWGFLYSYMIHKALCLDHTYILISLSATIMLSLFEIGSSQKNFQCFPEMIWPLVDISFNPPGALSVCSQVWEQWHLFCSACLCVCSYWFNKIMPTDCWFSSSLSLPPLFLPLLLWLFHCLPFPLPGESYQ